MCSAKQKNHAFILRIPSKTPEPIIAPLIRSTDSPPPNPPQHHATIPFGFHLQAHTHTFIQQQSFLPQYSNPPAQKLEIAETQNQNPHAATQPYHKPTHPTQSPTNTITFDL